MLTSFTRKALSSTTIKKRFMSGAITGVKGREIIDSRGNPTVEVDITTAQGTFTASVPSGASTGIYEAHELRDGGSRYMGKGVLKAVENVNTVLADVVKGMDAADQRAIDDAMLAADGTPNKANVGANAVLGSKCCVSLISFLIKRNFLLMTLCEEGSGWLSFSIFLPMSTCAHTSSFSSFFRSLSCREQGRSRFTRCPSVEALCRHCWKPCPKHAPCSCTFVSSFISQE